MLLEEGGSKALLPRFLIWMTKWLSGFIFSFVLAVFGLSVFEYGTFSFIFTLVAVQIFFWRWFHNSSLISVLLFDAGIVFLLLMFRLYVVLGPNI
ncbi:MAG: hypothetical protein ACRBBP_07770 [Bdellovibrionales bacterium]